MFLLEARFEARAMSVQNKCRKTLQIGIPTKLSSAMQMQIAMTITMICDIKIDLKTL
jgi:hypothetical protein